MRRAKDGQGTFRFQPATLKLTDEYHSRYRRIDQVLGETPEVLRCVHADLREALERVNRKRKRRCRYTSENVLRLVICQIIEGASLREIVVRVDDSSFLREFCRFGPDKMMGHTLFCALRNAIRPQTWKTINRALTRRAIREGEITGDEVRVDTTACETNIHYPTDSSLLWDVYRTIARLIRQARKLDSSFAANRRLHTKTAKRHYTAIHRAVGKNTRTANLKPQYEALLSLVGGVLEIGREVAVGLARGASSLPPTAAALAEELEHYMALGVRVVDQTERRVLLGEKVPNDEKLFSIFEPHTELLKRGKAGKPIEFGHMVLFAQTPEKFISDYDACKKKPTEHALVDRIIDRHTRLFGEQPSVFAADKGFYESPEKLVELETTIDVVAIGKKGKRTPIEEEREHSLAFKLGQAFRAGIEGTISFLKRSLRLHRCFNKGWLHYAATIGATVFAHNLLILARGGG
ncbi:MAG: ISNCY family transposase [Planctomycetes bacterium]|nr:ISNCY family transposase [Planctomycetota bacterium]